MRKKDKLGSLTSELILYQTEDGKTKIEVRLQNETVWLTQKLMAELFQTTPQNITIHHYCPVKIEYPGEVPPLLF